MWTIICIEVWKLERTPEPSRTLRIWKSAPKLMKACYLLSLVDVQSDVRIPSTRFQWQRQLNTESATKVKDGFTGCILPPERTQTREHWKKIVTVYRPGKPRLLSFPFFLSDRQTVEWFFQQSLKLPRTRIGIRSNFYRNASSGACDSFFYRVMFKNTDFTTRRLLFGKSCVYIVQLAWRSIDQFSIMTIVYRVTLRRIHSQGIERIFSFQRRELWLEWISTGWDLVIIFIWYTIANWITVDLNLWSSD